MFCYNYHLKLAPLPTYHWRQIILATESNIKQRMYTDFQQQIKNCRLFLCFSWEYPRCQDHLLHQHGIIFPISYFHSLYL